MKVNSVHEGKLTFSFNDVLTNLTFIGPCIVLYFYNKTN